MLLKEGNTKKKEAQNLKQIDTTTAFFAIRPPDKSYRLLKDIYMINHKLQNLSSLTCHLPKREEGRLPTEVKMSEKNI